MENQQKKPVFVFLDDSEARALIGLINRFYGSFDPASLSKREAAAITRVLLRVIGHVSRAHGMELWPYLVRATSGSDGGNGETQ